MHLLDLSQHVKDSVQAADLVAYRFNTVGVSDGISMGTDGMRYSLQSRDLIADSIETVMGAQWYDGLIALPGKIRKCVGMRTKVLQRIASAKHWDQQMVSKYLQELGTVLS